MSRNDHLRRNGLTFEEWLEKHPLPGGFRKWEGAYQHWDQGNHLNRAIHCFQKPKTAVRRGCSE